MSFVNEREFLKIALGLAPLLEFLSRSIFTTEIVPELHSLQHDQSQILNYGQFYYKESIEDLGLLHFPLFAYSRIQNKTQNNPTEEKLITVAFLLQNINSFRNEILLLIWLSQRKIQGFHE